MLCALRCGLRSARVSSKRAIAVSACFSNESAGSESQARIAVVGCGWWSQGWHIPHLHRNNNARLVGFCDPSEVISSVLKEDLLQLDELGDEYGVPTFSTLDEMLDAGVEADGVLVGSSHASHFQICKAALQAGLNVFCEKPMTMSVSEAKRLVQLVHDSGEDRVFMVNNTANWRQNTIVASKLVAGGRLGKVRRWTGCLNVCVANNAAPVVCMHSTLGTLNVCCRFAPLLSDSARLMSDGLAASLVF